jgi:hypothetical protein
VGLPSLVIFPIFQKLLEFVNSKWMLSIAPKVEEVGGG